jgi:hypothetical protein
VAKPVSPDEAVLAGLRKAFEALPTNKPLPLIGTGGLYSPKGKEFAEAAVAQGFLARQEGTVGSGKKAKKVVYGFLTEEGIRRVLDAASPKAALEALLPAVQAIGKQPASPNPEAFRAEVSRATEACVSAIKDAFAKLEGDVLKAVVPPPAPAADPGTVLHALRQALERVEAPAIPAVVAAPVTINPAPPPPAVATHALEEAILAFVNRWAKEKTVGCQFDVMWKHLKEEHPALTIGAFQDALRTLYDAGRIRLSGWSRMLDDMPQPQLALFVSSKVMYHAHPAHPNG